MLALIRDFFRLIIRRDSESAEVLAITVAEYLSDKALRDVKEYYAAYLELRQAMREPT